MKLSPVASLVSRKPHRSESTLYDVQMCKHVLSLLVVPCMFSRSHNEAAQEPLVLHTGSRTTESTALCLTDCAVLRGAVLCGTLSYMLTRYVPRSLRTEERQLYQSTMICNPRSSSARCAIILVLCDTTTVVLVPPATSY